MKALVYEAPRVLHIRNVEVPKPGPGEVLLRTRAVGICGSDVHGFLGVTGRRIPPLVMGHEAVGEIVSAGPDTSFDQTPSLGPGRLVAVNPLLVCGTCEFCSPGADNLCKNRRGLGMLTTPGAMSEFFVVPVGNLVPLPDVPPAVGALSEPLAVGKHAVSLLTRQLGTVLNARTRLAVIGAGFIGMSVLVALPKEAHSSVTVFDVRDDRLERVRRLLPTVTAVNTAGTTWEEVRRRHAPDGFDGVLEVVGRSSTAQGSVELVRPGGVIVWIGNWEPSVTVPMQRVVTQEVQIIGSYGFTSAEFRESVEQLASKPWLSGLVDRVLPLEAGPAAFEELAAGTTPVLKVVLDPSLRPETPERLQI